MFLVGLTLLVTGCAPHGDPCADLRLDLHAFKSAVIVGEARSRSFPGPGWVSAAEVNKSFAPINTVQGVEVWYDPNTKVQCVRNRELHLCNMAFEGHPADTCWSEVGAR